MHPCCPGCCKRGWQWPHIEHAYLHTISGAVVLLLVSSPRVAAAVIGQCTSHGCDSLHTCNGVGTCAQVVGAAGSNHDGHNFLWTHKSMNPCCLDVWEL